MSAFLLLVTVLLAGPVGLLAPEPPGPPGSLEPLDPRVPPPLLQDGGAVPKTVILGFDGLDYELTRRFMEAGDLPNFQRLSEQATFQRLNTTNPAQSAVSWAVFNTGSNPGKTGVGGFVGRKINHGGGMPVMPQLMLGFPDQIEADEFVRFPMALHNRLGFLGLIVGGALLVALILFKLILRMPMALAFLFSLGVAGFGGWQGQRYIDELPADGQLPYVVNPMQATNFWSYLDDEGIRLRGIQVSSTYPPDNEGPNTELLSGLGTPDIGGSPGSFYIYTDDPWTLKERTDNGGRLIRLYEDEIGRLDARLVGPRNWIEQARFRHEKDELERQKNNPSLSTGELKEVTARLDEVRAEERRWKSKGDKVTVPFVMTLDRQDGSIAFSIEGREFTVPTGGWSDFVPVEFVLNPGFSAYGLTRFHVVRCDEDEIRIFVPPISIDPDHSPEWLPICSPNDFSARLVADIGQSFETLGWACMTNPLKDIDDTHMGVQSFVDDIADNVFWRRKILDASLDDSDAWVVYYQVFGGTDRVAHMLFRQFDTSHPNHDPVGAAEEVTMFGETFPVGQTIREIYKEADRIVGDVLDRIDDGELGSDVLLLVVSDHGFTSWRYSINLNNVLADQGWLALKGGVSLDEYLAGGGSKEMLAYVDWENTKAYSMGLGKVFINLAGREPNGAVQPEDYDATVEAIRDSLLRLTNADGQRIVTSVMRRDELFDGPWWKEGRATRIEHGEAVEVDHDGFADLFMGYAPYHRVAGSNTLGGLGSAAITENKGQWSGDHVSVDPSHVPGVLFSNQVLVEPADAGLIDIGPTVLHRYGIDVSETDMDGTPLVFAGS